MRRVISTLAAAVCLAGLLAGLRPAAADAAATRCRTAHAHWSVTEGDVSIKIAWIEMYLEVCTNGLHITSTNAWTDSGMTGPGIAAGFVFSFGSPHRTSFVDYGFGGGRAAYAANGTSKDCANHWVHIFCSPTENFRVRGRVIMADGLYIRPPGPNWETINGRFFRFVFRAGCTNSACELHFHR